MIYASAFTFAYLFTFAVRPFRCASTNFLMFFQFLHLAFPMYMVSQEINGMENGLLVNKYFSICLEIFIGVFGGAQLLVIIL